MHPAAALADAAPAPYWLATLGDKMNGSTCAGVWVTGLGKDGQPREVYLYHVVDNDTTMFEHGTQCVVWRTAVNPVVALELLANGTWCGSGALGPEAFDAVALIDLLAGGYGSPWGIAERKPRPGERSPTRTSSQPV
jgi:saccharopine dehydrogenase-like NADP-dependent oxidoreductase